MPYKTLPHPCVDCEKPVNNHASRCSKCAKIRARTNNPEGYKARMARARKSRKEKGTCVTCGGKRKSKLYCFNCLEKLKNNMKEERRRLRDTVIQHYGEKCECCGEPAKEFLSIDHINGGGNKHRKAIKSSGINLYRWLKNNNYPSGYRVLCMNCNWAIGIYGEKHIKALVEARVGILA